MLPKVLEEVDGRVVQIGERVLAVCAIQLNGQTDRVIRTVRSTVRTRTVDIPQ
jgi:hypothetical protein